MVEETKPRKPVAASFTGPGPAGYTLPTLSYHEGHDPRSVKQRLPAYQFGIKHGALSKDSSPGPVHLPPATVSRYGPDGTPHFSLLGRIRELRGFQNPGPGSYSPEHAGPSARHSAPNFSFGCRTNHRISDSNPAPNTYSLPAMIGESKLSNKRQAPMFTLRGRSTVGGFDEDLKKTPGPGSYNVTIPDIYRSNAPSYSLLGRNTMPGDSTTKPGPGAHCPERVVINKKQAPLFSFGIRHSQYECPLIVDTD